MAEWNNGIGKITLPTPFSVGDVNVYVIKTDTITMIDAGVKTEQAWEKLIAELKSLKLEPSDIEQVVLTHHHPDHVGLLDFLPNATVYGHSYCERWLTRDERFMEEYREFFRKIFDQLSVPHELRKNIQRMEKSLDFASHRPLDETLHEGVEIEGLPGWMVLETPGHAQSHICLFHEKTGIMFGGDHIIATISSNPLLEPPLTQGMERPKPQLQYNESLRKLKHYSIELVYSGHGQEVRRVHSLIDRRLTRQHERAMKVKEMIQDNALTGFEICRNLFPLAYEKELGLTISETVGQLDYLLSIGEIQVIQGENGEERYLAVN